MIKHSEKSCKAKTVHIIARYFVKQTGAVIYAVRSSNGVDVYHTTIINGHAAHCSCPSRKPCYHMEQLQQREMTRMALAALAGWMNGFAAARKVPDEPAREGVYAERLRVWADSLAADAYEVLAATKQTSAAESCRSCGQLSRDGLCARCAGA